MNQEKESFNEFLKYKIQWTILWMIFILTLCAMFHNGWSLLLLIFWIMGVV